MPVVDFFTIFNRFLTISKHLAWLGKDRKWDGGLIPAPNTNVKWYEVAYFVGKTTFVTSVTYVMSGNMMS